ncbi:hypothetical protein BsWGS_06445 [Bradybaena similaris]
MNRRAQDGLEALNLNLEEIDDWELSPQEQDSWSNSTLVSTDSNNYDSNYNLVFRNNDDQPLTLPDYDYQLSTAASRSSLGLASSAVVRSSLDSNASSSESLPVKQRLQDKVMKKIIAEGRQNTLLTLSPKETVADQLTPEEEKKKREKQERNKDAARRSRQKKKEGEQQLLTKNKMLIAKQEELKRDVAYIRCVNQKFEDYLDNHPCVIPPQQDNGDQMSVETGTNKIWGDDYDRSCISDVLELMTINNLPLQVSQGSKSQRVHAILCELQEGQQSEIVPSGTAYAPAGYNNGFQESSLNSLCSLAIPSESKTAAGAFSIQETSLNSCHSVANSGELHTGVGAFGIQGTSPDNLYNGANPEGSKTGAMACGGKFSEMGPTTEVCNPHYMGVYQWDNRLPPRTDLVTQMNNSSVSLMNPCKSNTTYAWATGEGNLSEIEEARRAVLGLSPPPEKKIRRE